MISLRDAPASTLLRTYLNDHLAASTAGVELAKRCLSSNRGTELGAFLRDFLREIQQERRDLQRLIAALGFSEARPKVLAAIAGERAGRIKLNGQLLGYSDLSRLFELEGLTAGVHAKLSLWQALATVADAHPTIAETIDPDALRQKARRQLDALEEYRQVAARRAFA